MLLILLFPVISVTDDIAMCTAPGDAERALRLLTTSASSIQREMIGAVERLLDQEVDTTALSYPMSTRDLAYLVIRIGESFIYTDLITGGVPDSGKARTALLALLS